MIRTILPLLSITQTRKGKAKLFCDRASARPLVKPWLLSLFISVSLIGLQTILFVSEVKLKIFSELFLFLGTGTAVAYCSGPRVLL